MRIENLIAALIPVATPFFAIAPLARKTADFRDLSAAVTVRLGQSIGLGAALSTHDVVNNSILVLDNTVRLTAERNCSKRNDDED